MSKGLLVAVSLFLAAGPASADSAAEALKFIEVGVTFYKANDLEAARSSFARACNLMPDKPGPFRWLGLTQAKLGRCAEAVSSLDKFLSGISAADPRFAEAAAVRDTCRATLPNAAEPPRPAPAITVIPVKPPAPAVVANPVIPPKPPASIKPPEAPGTVTPQKIASPPATPLLPVVVATPPIEDSAPRPASTPIYKRWWLWTAVAAVVAAGAAATAIAFLTPNNVSPPQADYGSMRIQF